MTEALSEEEVERVRQIRFEVLAVDDGVEKSVLQQKLRALEARGQALPHGLFDDARPGKSNQRAGLGNVQVPEHGIACGNAAGGGIGEHGEKRQAYLIEPP